MKDNFIYYMLAINIFTALLTFFDKWASLSGRRRVSEKTLMSFAAFGGSLGLYLAMYIFRHKTRHPKFYLGVPVIMLIQLVLIWWYYPVL